MHNMRERERERVQRQWIKHKHQDMFRGSSHCSTFPPSHRRIFTISSTQDFPHREPPLRIWTNTIRSTQLLSPTNTTSTQEARHNNNHLSLEGYALSQTTINLSLEGLGSKPHNHNHLPLEGQGTQLNFNLNHLYTQRDTNTTSTITSA